MNNYVLIISAMSAVIAASAFVVALMNYLTSRKLPNENKIFEEKIRSYQTVIKALNAAAAVFITCADEYQEVVRKGGDKRKTKTELEQELTDGYYQLEDTLYEQSLLLPDEIVERVYDYFELFDRNDFLQDMANEARIEAFEEDLNDRFDAVVDAMREDLAFEKLDIGLKKRIGGRHRKETMSEEEV